MSDINFEELKNVGCFAAEAHKDQCRKYTFEPYVKHPFAVAGILADYDIKTKEVIEAAFLHDVVEDTQYTISDINNRFGDTVAEYVYFLTKPETPPSFNRERRKEIYRNHIAQAPKEVFTIKLADILHNLPSIVEHDPGFAKVYVKEIKLLLPVLKAGNPRMMNKLTTMIHWFEKGSL